MERVYFSISLIEASQNIVKGIYSNKSKLYKAINDCIIDNNFTESSFVNVFNYDKNKKVNYDNITSLLRILFINESFLIKLSKDNQVCLFEITKLSMNNNKIAIN